LAKDVEPCHPPQPVHQKKATVPFHNYYQKNTYTPVTRVPNTPAVSLPVTGNRNIETPNTNVQRIRKAGECWRCGDKWVHGHKCTLVPNVHMLQQELEETRPQENDAETTEVQEELADQPEQSMFISSYAMGQQLSVQTPTVVVFVNGKRAIALLDSGSSTSFMSEQFAVKANCYMLPVRPRNICSWWRTIGF